MFSLISLKNAKDMNSPSSCNVEQTDLSESFGSWIVKSLDFRKAEVYSCLPVEHHAYQRLAGARHKTCCHIVIVSVVWHWVCQCR